MTEPILADEHEETDNNPELSTLALLKSERNRWFVFCVGLAVALTFSVCLLFVAFVQAQATKEILYVKLRPDGSWSVVDYKPQDEQLYFKTTVDSLLERFAVVRYGINPETIRTDWGEASVFMSEPLQANFLDKNGFNALEKIKKVSKGNTTVKIEVRNTEHYDNIQWEFSENNSVDAIKSNIYMKRTITVNGIERKPENLVLTLSWHLIDKDELTKKDRDVIRLNPIGIEVLKYDLKKERSSE
ncbi:VirB8/TrbF family protein [Vibrio europaeus]|uniref:VirB8/TrbF family protein n=1 Tax=Vibrio europaeus TaxID=300876 RepID=UPI00233F21F6|nr:VirB8/TrbF family protein [Vibrio europaeus]MDC5711164.1 VirB8/TrbF family protein [Vibrio europaeus]MDC5713193.1 VirB8/TrbF family protein [Vibrio europaeus]